MHRGVSAWAMLRNGDPAELPRAPPFHAFLLAEPAHDGSHGDIDDYLGSVPRFRVHPERTTEQACALLHTQQSELAGCRWMFCQTRWLESLAIILDSHGH